MEIKVNVKHMGKRKQSVETVIYDWPLGESGDGAPGHEPSHMGGGSFTVRELITELTKAGVEDYNKRLEQPEILKCLTKEEIGDKAAGGKISFGAVYGDKEADPRKAADNAIQCFEDGIYRIFLDNRPLESLDERLKVTGENVFTFVRLTMLTGRMW